MPGSREFRRLLAAAFVSQTGSHFLTLSITAFVYLSSGSAVRAALVFVLSYLPSVLLSGSLGPWVDGHISRRFLIGNEMVSIAVSAACALALWSEAVGWLGLFIALRSLCLFTGRAGMTKWVKTISRPEEQKKRIQLFFLTFFLSTGVSGLMAAAFLSKVSILAILAIDTLTYLLSAWLISRLEELPKADGPSAAPVGFPLGRLFADPRLARAAVSVAFSQALFQGAYSVLVTYLPVHQLGLGLSGVGMFQMAATLGILAGFVANWKVARLPPTGLLAATASVALLGLAYLYTLPLALGAFWLLNFAYECVWLNQSSEFFQAMPQRESASLQFTLNAFASFLMAVWTLLYALAIEAWGIGSALPACLVLGCALWGLLASRKAVAVEVGR